MMNDYYDVKGEMLSRDIKLENGKKSAVRLLLWLSLSSLISEHVLRACALIRALRPGVTHNYHVVIPVAWTPERPVIYDGVFRLLWKGVQRQGQQSECGRPAASSPHTD